MPKQKKLLVVCGPTATGKTRLALHLAQKFKGELISADSRQVYRGMNIGTGKDLPPNAKFSARGGSALGGQMSLRRQSYGSAFAAATAKEAASATNIKLGFYKIRGIKVWGYDLVWPDGEFSVKNYLDFAYQVIKKIYDRGKLPILVGGTGLYIKAVTEPLPGIYNPKDPGLRKRLMGKSAAQLFETLMKKSPALAIRLNPSDRSNPRRLIRALEIVSYGKFLDPEEERVDFDSILWVGLTTDRRRLYERVNKRVEERINSGFGAEIDYLRSKDFLKAAPSVTLGYREWSQYLDNKIGKDEAIEKWQAKERQYARRQMTWFRKDKRINWFDVSSPLFLENVEKLVKNWYYNK